jgi:hypothetical protein
MPATSPEEKAELTILLKTKQKRYLFKQIRNKMVHTHFGRDKRLALPKGGLGNISSHRPFAFTTYQCGKRELDKRKTS